MGLYPKRGPESMAFRVSVVGRICALTSELMPRDLDASAGHQLNNQND